MSGEHVESLIGAYALGALSAAERSAVEAHVIDCGTCAGLLAAMERVTAMLPYSVTPYQAPPDLREALQRRIEPVQGGTQPAAREAPAWAQPETRAPWARLLLQTVPWTAAAIGWLVAALLLIYSHGQSDRIATSKLDDQVQIDDLTAQRNNALTVQQYLATPGVRVLPLLYKAGQAPHTTVNFILASGYAHGVIVARGLRVLGSDRAYKVWALQAGGTYVGIGSLVTSGPRAEGVSLVVAPAALNTYTMLGISLERLPLHAQPTGPLIFAGRI